MFSSNFMEIAVRCTMLNQKLVDDQIVLSIATSCFRVTIFKSYRPLTLSTRDPLDSDSSEDEDDNSDTDGELPVDNTACKLTRVLRNPKTRQGIIHQIQHVKILFAYSR